MFLISTTTKARQQLTCADTVIRLHSHYALDACPRVGKQSDGIISSAATSVSQLSLMPCPALHDDTAQRALPVHTTFSDHDI